MPPITPGSAVKVIRSMIRSSLATAAIPSGMPMPRLTTLLAFSSNAARRAMILRSLIGIGGSAPARTLISLDVSGSMSMPNFTTGHQSLYERTGMTPRDLSAAMSMITMRTEPEYAVGAFSTQYTPLNISAAQRLDDVIRVIQGTPMGGTDCSLPMQWAQANNLMVDTFQVWTDNETWAGRTMHPHEALRRYRQHSGINARLQVIGMTATDFTIADPADPGQLDVAGFDAAVPQLLADHARGNL